jgi:hypothetical protein
MRSAGRIAAHNVAASTASGPGAPTCTRLSGSWWTSAAGRRGEPAGVPLSGPLASGRPGFHLLTIPTNRADRIGLAAGVGAAEADRQLGLVRSPAVALQATQR